MARKPKFTSIDQYIASASPDVQSILQEIRRIIKTEVPTAVETISYQLPAFKLDRVRSVPTLLKQDQLFI